MLVNMYRYLQSLFRLMYFCYLNGNRMMNYVNCLYMNEFYSDKCITILYTTAVTKNITYRYPSLDNLYSLGSTTRVSI